METSMNLEYGQSSNPGAFHKASNFNIYYPTFYDVSNLVPDTFMTCFAQYAMTDAAYDSSARDPPSRCLPGTRLEAVKYAHSFFEVSGCKKKLLWIVGPAGVGKSAVMQTIAETFPNLGASLFFTQDIHDDASKIFVTLAYQLAVKHPAYRNHLRQKLTNDPTLWKKAMMTQFNAFFIEPFMESAIYSEPQPLLILIDGMDECAGTDNQLRILEIILAFTLAYPSAPLLWVIASRPEPHITSFFDRLTPASPYVKAELSVDSDESRQDVERYLRHELEVIKRSHPVLSYILKWPSEGQLLTLTTAADGLFIFATTAVRFIKDPAIGNPASQLCLLVNVINYTSISLPRNTVSPLAQLYALYESIVSRVPSHIFPDTRRLLVGNGVIDDEIDAWGSFMWGCSFIGMTPESAYGALYHLHSVLDIPSPVDADTKRIKAYHKSFSDYLRIKFPNVRADWEELEFHCAIRILKDIPAQASHNPCNNVVLHWPELDVPPEEQKSDLHYYASHDLTNSKLLAQYLLNVDVNKIHPDIIHALQVIAIGPDPHNFVTCRDSTYDWFLDNESLVTILRAHGLVRDIPIGSLDLTRVNTSFYLHATCDARKDLNSSLVQLSRTLTCKELDHDWTHSRHKRGLSRLTKFSRCGCPCNAHVWDHLKRAQATKPGRLILAYIPAHRRGVVICHIADENDETKTWKYVIPYTFQKP